MMAARWRRELASRRKEARAKVMIHFANRTWQQNPTRREALTSRLVGMVAASWNPDQGEAEDLYLEEQTPPIEEPS